MIKNFTEFIGENFSHDEESRLRDMGLAPTRWYVSLMIDLYAAANTASDQLKEDFENWVESDFSDGDWRIKAETISVEDWDPESFEFGEVDMDDAPSIEFELVTRSQDEAEVEAWIRETLVGRVFDDINDLQRIEAEEL